MPNLTLVCDAQNDLFLALKENGFAVDRAENPAQAIGRAKAGSAVMILADHYPTAATHIGKEIFDAAETKNLKLYVEFPDSLPDRPVGNIRAAEIERGVICGNAFGRELPDLSIVAIHDARFVEVQAENSHLVLARVAGFQTAVYGLPEKNVFPILFEIPGKNVLVATTKLSQFITARYAPGASWQHIWRMILSRLMPGEPLPLLNWQPSVAARYSRDEKLPADAAEIASREGAQWFIDSRMLNAADWKPDNTVNGDGSEGVLECLVSKIRVDGSQSYGTALRDDCACEVAMALAVRAAVGDKTQYGSNAANILNFIFGPTGFQLDPCNDPKSPVYGLLSWSSGSREVYFGDDNARAILGIMAVSAALKDDRWNEKLCRAILSNFRTSGYYALQGHNLWEQLVYKFGWEHYWHKTEVRLAPHFESWLLACFLWLYGQTKFQPLLERTRRGIKKMMQAYPHDWRWTNGLQQERARMLLPLAWLVRVDDTPEHRGWLHQIANDLLAAQDECGAIREELGELGHGTYGPPKTNEAFGTNEAPLIHLNGEPVSDLLYTSNFALVSLTEAAAATGDAKLEKAAEKLAEFIVRIQVSSPTHRSIDRAWFRAFDYEKWEHWGSSADGGWGPWCAETGWTQGWIVTMLTLRHRKTNFWDYTANTGISRVMDKVRAEMLPDRVINDDTPAVKKQTPGSFRKDVFHDDIWTCYVGRDLEATFDLGKPYKVTRLGVTCAHAPTRGLNLPQRVDFSISTDGKTFQPAGHATPNGATGSHMSSHILSSSAPGTEARYVKFAAVRDASKPIAKPTGEQRAAEVPGAPSKKQWMFIDEIIVDHQ